MASTNEITFGSKINNAKTLLTHLKTFVNYTPLQSKDSLTELDKQITLLYNIYTSEASYTQSYSLSVDIRQKLLKTNTNSLVKIITSINGYVKAMYGKDSKEASTINEQIVKMRGTKTTKLKPNATDKTVSTSQLSYASVTQAFSNLIASLEMLTPVYNPPNDAITLTNLKEKLSLIQQATVQINTTIGELTKSRNQRDLQYSVLKESCLRTKEAVKSQYGNSSVEYGLIKGLKF